MQVEIESDASLKNAFADQYQTVYGHRPGEREIELVSLRVVASSRPPVEEESAPPAEHHGAEPNGMQKAFFLDAWIDVPVFDRERLTYGARVQGPALVFERYSVTVVERVDGRDWGGNTYYYVPPPPPSFAMSVEDIQKLIEDNMIVIGASLACCGLIAIGIAVVAVAVMAMRRR